ncbi:MAG: ATPase, T2SS/T4P/T4SS family [Planctomycetota bacterium]
MSQTSASSAAPGRSSPRRADELIAEDILHYGEPIARDLYVDMFRLTLDRLKHWGDRASARAAADETDSDSIAATLLSDAAREGASDIHVDPMREGAMVRFRVNGLMYDVAELLPHQTARLVNQIKTSAEIDPMHAFRPIEGRWRHEAEGRSFDLRVTCVPSVSGDKLTVRVLDPQRIGHQLHDLGLSEAHRQEIEDWTEYADGLFLSVGPTGAGKTTTLYALLHKFRDTDKSVVTIEDPVEYRLDGLTQIQVDTRHALTFANGLRSMLRLDPDYMMVGEVRDDASAHAAVEAAVTGRVVISTIHCGDAAASVTALRNWGLTNHQIAASLRVVVAQRLLRRLDPKRRIEVRPNDADLAWLRAVGAEPPSACFARDPDSEPDELHGPGRVGLFEVLRLREDDLDLILRGAGQREMRRGLAEREHRTLIDDGLAKVEAGLVSLGDLRRCIGVPVLPK